MDTIRRELLNWTMPPKKITIFSSPHAVSQCAADQFALLLHYSWHNDHSVVLFDGAPTVCGGWVGDVMKVERGEVDGDRDGDGQRHCICSSRESRGRDRHQLGRQRQRQAVTGYFYSPAHWQSAAAWIRLIILFLFFFLPKKEYLFSFLVWTNDWFFFFFKSMIEI